MLRKRVESHVFEKIIVSLMVFFGLLSVYVLYLAMQTEALALELAVIGVLIILIMSSFIQTIVLIRIFENTK